MKLKFLSSFFCIIKNIFSRDSIMVSEPSVINYGFFEQFVTSSSAFPNSIVEKLEDSNFLCGNNRWNQWSNLIVFNGL